MRGGVLVDSNVVLDVLTDDSQWSAWSSRALDRRHRGKNRDEKPRIAQSYANALNQDLFFLSLGAGFFLQLRQLTLLELEPLTGLQITNGR